MPGRNPLVPVGADRLATRILGKMRTDQCVIQRRVPGRGPSGAANSGAYAPVATADCRVVASQRAATIGTGGGSRFVATGDYELVFGREVVVEDQDLIIVTPAAELSKPVDDRSTQRYTVASVGEASHGFQLTVQVKEASS